MVQVGAGGGGGREGGGGGEGDILDKGHSPDVSHSLACALQSFRKWKRNGGILLGVPGTGHYPGQQ